MRADIEDLLRDFYTVSGMDISVVDRDFHTLSLTRSQSSSLCSLIHRDPLSTDVCKASDIERLLCAKNSAEPLLYTCPFGITEAIAPIIRNDEPIGYVISALGIEKGNEDNILELCSTVRGTDTEIFKELIRKTRKHTCEEINAYFNIIKMLADYISNDDSMMNGETSIGQLIKRYIKNNLSRKLTLKDIARNLHCSTVTLTEHFKAEFGITVNAYIVRKRMEYAELLLLTTDHSLREIASTIGFSDVEYFSRTFKHHYGDSPARWRRSTRKSAEDSPE